jgi:hypothetical protein
VQGLLDYPLKPALTWSNRPGFWPVAARTATSLGGEGASIFVSLSWGSPVKYTDPDGKIQRNKDGTLKFEAGEQGPGGHRDGTVSEKGQYGNLFADDGTPIAAFQNLDSTAPGLDTDCHGVTFADGQYWINRVVQ